MSIWIVFLDKKIELTFESKGVRAVFLNEVTEQEEGLEYKEGKLIVPRKFQGDIEWLKQQM